MRRWFHGEHAWETPVAEVDLRLGGNVRVVMRDPEKDVEHGGGGHYTVIDRPTRLAFTWTWDDEEDRETLIELDFEEVDGATTVRLTHSGLRDHESVISHEGGWSNCMDSLGWAIEEALRRDLGPDALSEIWAKVTPTAEDEGMDLAQAELRTMRKERGGQGST